MKKRALSLALVLCMMLALVPALGVSAAAAEYTTYEYVRTTGRQFANLGIKTSDVTGAQIKFTTDIPCSLHTGVNHYLLGGYDYWDYDGDGKKNALRWSILTLAADGKFGCMFPSVAKEAEVIMGSTDDFGVDSEIDYEYVIRNGYQKVVRGETTKTANKAVYNVNFNHFDLYLFTGSGPDIGSSDARRTQVDPADNQPKFGWIGKLYSCKLFKDDIENKADTENHNVVMDLVAAKDASGAIGVLNKVDGSFFPIAGEDLNNVELGAQTGTFSGNGTPSTPDVPVTPDVPSVPESGTAYANKVSVNLDGNPTVFDMYMLVDENGGETNYIKLRDIAFLLNGTPANFEVGFDGTISLTTGKAYTPVGGEMETPFSGERAYKVCDTAIKVNGQVPALAGITLTDDNGGDYNYFKLRDLGTALGFKVDYDGATNMISVITK